MSPGRLSGRSCTVDFRSQLSMSAQSTRLCAAERIRGENGGGRWRHDEGECQDIREIRQQKERQRCSGLVTTVMMSSSAR